MQRCTTESCYARSTDELTIAPPSWLSCIRLHPSCLQGYLDQVSVPSDLRGRRYEEMVQDLMADGKRHGPGLAGRQASSV